jgi:hypothetical protein
MTFIKKINQLVIWKFIKYNLKIVFGNKFVYFLGASLIFYFLIAGISLFGSDPVSVDDVYFQLMFPSLLLIFFPTAYGIQNDEDARIIEILFGIPNYRYIIWMVRLLMAFFMAFWFLLALSGLSHVLLINIPRLEMALRLMVPVSFFGMLGFFFSTVVRNGNGTAVVVVVVGLVVWILVELLEGSPWNVFLNPFDMPSNMSETVWQNVVAKHIRTWLIVALVAGLGGLLNLQNREKFIK